LDLWEDLYRRAAEGNPLAGTRCILAYNSVLDLVKTLDEEALGRLPLPSGPPDAFPAEPDDLRGLGECLAYAMTRGIALEVLCGDGVMKALEDLGPFEVRPGGQVVNIAILLSNFGAHRILVHPDRFDERIARLYEGVNAVVPRRGRAGLELIPARDCWWECNPEVHLILEYPKGLAHGGPPAPRANRIIAAPRTKVEFDPDFEECLPEMAKACDRAILAGLNHMGSDVGRAYGTVRRHIGTLREANPSVKIHLEFTSMQGVDRRAAALREVLPMVDSAGLNEAELAEVAQVLGLPAPDRVRGDVVAQVEALEAMRALGVRRLHLHTLGYYLCLTPNDGVGVRRALLFSALVAAARALWGRVPTPSDLGAALQVPTSPHGLSRLRTLGECLGHAPGNPPAGIFADCGLVGIPTKVVETPKATVGMGDFISGSAFVAEEWGGDA
jgi:ADP-dependent phosphofructokinase/glucokinase